jgi:sugar phosphate isomerase/epimerase
MFAVSTCWKSSYAKRGDDIIRPIAEAGIDAVELEYRITEDVFRDMVPALKRGKPIVLSVHNFFPLPSVLSSDQASGDSFLLSSPDKEERERAVTYTLRTLEHAHEVGAAAVVLHLGRTDMDDGFSRLKEEQEAGTLGSTAAQTYIRQLLKERRTVTRKHLDAALFSLDKLWRPAERFAIKLGVENRYYLKEIPNADELRVILDTFEGGPVAYWHDVGHAAVQETFYGIEHEELLSEFSPCLLGVHLHDAEGARDHRAPGTGNVDFEMLRNYISSATIRVMEPSPDVSDKQLREGVAFLRQKGVLIS